MSGIRSFRPADIPQVAKLYEELLVGEPLHESAREHYASVFFENPWYDERLPSLVFEGDDAQVVGFLGVIPRPMTFRGRALVAAVSTQFMVSKRWRAHLPAIQLLKAFFSGPQDLSYADHSSDESRRVWEGLGGFSSHLHSIHWTRLLRPFEYVRVTLRDRGVSAPLLTLTRPAAALGDVIAKATRYAKQVPSTLACEEVDPGVFARHAMVMPRDAGLAPVYDESSLAWLLALLSAEDRLGKLQTVIVRDQSGGMVGGYCYYLSREGVGEIVHLNAERQRAGEVLDSLFDHAARRGACAVRGRFHRDLTERIASRFCALRLRGPWTLFHTQDPELQAAIFSGDTDLGGLDGERWVDFGRFRLRSQ